MVTSVNTMDLKRVIAYIERLEGEMMDFDIIDSKTVGGYPLITFRWASIDRDCELEVIAQYHGGSGKCSTVSTSVISGSLDPRRIA